MDIESSLPSLNKTAEKYKEKAQALLKYCPTCQPYDGDSYVWILGSETSIDEILDLVDCPETYRDDISQHLYCPNCGRENFERYDTAGTEDSYTLKAEQHYERALKKFGNKIEKFKEHIEAYPSLSLHDSLGKRLFKEIIEEKAETITIGVEKWYRARKVEQEKVFKSEDLHAPPIGVSGGGRFHHPGQSVLYLAAEKDLAISECLSNYREPSLIWMQDYSMVNPVDNILDLRYDWDNFAQLSNDTLAALLASGSIFRREEGSGHWKPHYLLTRFLADCARLAGYNGILYSSAKDSGFNLVVFKNDNYFVPKGRPYVLIHEMQSLIDEREDEFNLPF